MTEEFINQLGRPRNIKDVLAVFSKLTPDAPLTKNIKLFKTVLKQNKPCFWEMCCALNLYAKLYHPKRYLEIGVRTGRSMAQVASMAPECNIIGIDPFHKDYGGNPNPGPSFVHSELDRCGFKGNILFHVQPSSQVFNKKLSVSLGMQGPFDIITVDGDHTNKGAMADLEAVVPLIADGGMIVFDDITHSRHTLGKVWRQFRQKHSDHFSYYSNLQDMHGTGLAFKQEFII